MLIKKKKLANIKSLHTIVTPIQPSESTRAAQLEIHKAKQEAKAIKEEAEKVLLESNTKLQEAQKKARELIQDANIEAKNIKEKVYKETLNKAIQESEVIKNEARELLLELFEVKRKALDQAHRQIINIALDLATKIIRYQASVDPNVLKVQVVEAIKKATTEADRVQVFVNPSDLKTLQENIPEISNLFPKGVDIIPLAKESVDLGSCILETKSGQLDASFSTQLGVLTGLLNHLEVKEPEITIDENIPISYENPEPQVVDEDLTSEEEILKQELFSEEPLLKLPEETVDFQFKSGEPLDLVEEDILEIPEEIAQKISNEIPPESKKEEIIDKPVPKIKKESMENLFERTKEEAEELDEISKEESQIEIAVPESAKTKEELIFEYEEDDELEEEKEEAIDTSRILKPKKKPSTQVSDIASELEKNPEWKDLVQGEDEE